MYSLLDASVMHYIYAKLASHVLTIRCISYAFYICYNIQSCTHYQMHQLCFLYMLHYPVMYSLLDASVMLSIYATLSSHVLTISCISYAFYICYTSQSCTHYQMHQLCFLYMLHFPVMYSLLDASVMLSIYAKLSSHVLTIRCISYAFYICYTIQSCTHYQMHQLCFLYMLNYPVVYSLLDASVMLSIYATLSSHVLTIRCISYAFYICYIIQSCTHYQMHQLCFLYMLNYPVMYSLLDASVMLSIYATLSSHVLTIRCISYALYICYTSQSCTHYQMHQLCFLYMLHYPVMYTLLDASVMLSIYATLSSHVLTIRCISYAFYIC